jgi:two-component system, sensor histidine kinase and response regulator
MSSINAEKKHSVLIADDNPNNLKILSVMLEELGYRVRVAKSGEQALQSLESQLPDILLLDIHMPGIDGYEVCRRIKASEKARDLPVIFISALSEMFNKIQAFEAGGIDYITKPFELDEVRLRVETQIRLRENADLRMRMKAYSDAKAELEAQVAERTAALSASNVELESFAYSVSHDLRSPLRAIDGFARILLEQHSAALDPEGLRLLGIVLDSAKTMDRLISDLLEISRLGRTALVRTRVDMGAKARAAFEGIVAPLGGGGFELVLGAIPEAMADPAMMERVWTNLISNSVKYSRDSPEKRIEIEASVAEGMTAYSVRDRGVGFDPRYADKLFGLFQRLHGPAEFEGTGVGLAIVKRLVERHGGTVRAEGRPGEGATFYFSLPSAGLGQDREP